MLLSASPVAAPQRGMRHSGAWVTGAVGRIAALVAAVAVGVAAAAEGPGLGVDSACPPAAGRDVWVVSTRGLPDICRRPGHVGLGVERLDEAARRWERGDLADLLADPLQPLAVFVHGNRYDSVAAKEQGLRLAARLARRRDAAGVRTVIFSWPSDKRGILVRDSRRKYDRAFSDGLYLSWFLGHIQPERPVALVGYSFGGLVALEALTDRARDEGTAWASRRGRTHLMLVTPAVRGDAFSARGPYRAGLDGIDRLGLVINSSDRALRFFRLVDPMLGLDALGFVGVSPARLPAGLDSSSVDAAPIIGRDHSFKPYLESATLGTRIADVMLDGLRD
jgi:hypothetical protein